MVVSTSSLTAQILHPLIFFFFKREYLFGTKFSLHYNTTQQLYFYFSFSHVNKICLISMYPFLLIHCRIYEFHEDSFNSFLSYAGKTHTEQPLKMWFSDSEIHKICKSIKISALKIWPKNNVFRVIHGKQKLKEWGNE